MYINISLNNINDFSLGIHTQRGNTEYNQEFYEIVFGFLLFEFTIGKIYEIN